MGIGIKELLIILIIIILLFGTKKLKNIGSDLGAAIKGFRKSVGDEEDKQAAANIESHNSATIDGKAEKVEEKK